MHQESLISFNVPPQPNFRAEPMPDELDSDDMERYGIDPIEASESLEAIGLTLDMWDIITEDSHADIKIRALAVIATGKDRRLSQYIQLNLRREDWSKGQESDVA